MHVKRVYVEGGRSGLGGAFYVQSGSLHLEDVVLKDNHAIKGGAIYLESGGKASLRTNLTTFVNNSASTELWDGVASGGAIFLGAQNIAIVRDSIFTMNVAKADRATAIGGAVDIWGVLSVVNSVFYSNSAIGPVTEEGTIGGFSLTRSLGAGDGRTDTVPTGSVMSTPTGTGSGGALYCRGTRGNDPQGGCTLTVLRCDLSRNSATSSGGAIYSVGDVVVRDSTGWNNTARMGPSARVGMGGEFQFTNTPFLHNDELIYPDSAEFSHATSVISDDGRGWPIMSTGDDKPGVLSEYDKYSGYYGCPSGSLDRCLELCSANPRLPQNDPTTHDAAIQPDTFMGCVRVCRTFCKW